MRALLHALLFALAVLLWSASLFVGWRVPFEVTVRPAPPGVVQAPGQPERWVRATVTATYPGLEGLALGDAVQFDRYGVLAPSAGSARCLPLPPPAP